MSATFKNTVFNLINHKETNIIVTACLLFISIYIALAAILDRNLVDPMGYGLANNQMELHVPRVSPPEFNNDSAVNRAIRPIKEPSIWGRYNESIEPPSSYSQEHQIDVVEEHVNQSTTIMSLFFLLIVALLFGRFVGYFYLPSLLGMLLAGILIRNVDAFAEFWQINSDWDQVLRQFAFILILIRCGVNLEPEALRQSLTTFISLGLLSTTAEAAAIILAAYYLFEIPLATSLLFGYILSATSPAVTIPAIISLQEKGYGRDKGIPTTILASVSIDNIYCITAFTVVGSIVFTRNEDIIYLSVRIPTEILVGALVGILIGLLLRVFPRSDIDLVHFVRSIFICSASVAVLFGADAIGCFMAGPIAVLLLCVISSMRWKMDNHQSTRKEEHCYRILWDLIFQPFLFALIGLLFDFSQMSWEIFWNAIAIILIGVGIRFVVILIMSLFIRFDAKEKLFISLCFFPKASVQAALAPLIFQYQTVDSTPQHMQTIFQTCVLSILITAPIGQLMIELLGKVLLNKHVELTKRNMDPLPLPAFSTPKFDSEREPSFLISDPDNRLRLKVNGKPKVLSNFEEINKQAYDIFKEQRIGGKGTKLGTFDEITTLRNVTDEVDNNKPSMKF